MKYIVLSFDDGRKDFSTRIMPVLKKYNLTATVNIISDFVGSHAPSGFLSCKNEFMTNDDIRSAYEYGIEIGNHGKNHTNEVQSITEFSIDDEKINASILNSGGGMASLVPEVLFAKKMPLYT